MRIEIKTKNEEHEAVLRLYAPILQKMMDSLRKEFRFKQPKSIVLRPRRNRWHKDTFANGLASPFFNGNLKSGDATPYAISNTYETGISDSDIENPANGYWVD